MVNPTEGDRDEAQWLDPSAPLDLAEATVAVRNALVDSDYGGVTAACREACQALGLMLRDGGQGDLELVHLTFNGFPHFILRAGSWALDPTAEQFGAEGPLVYPFAELPVTKPFEIAIPELEQPPPGARPDCLGLNELELICRLAEWIRKEASGERVRHDTPFASLTASELRAFETTMREATARLESALEAKPKPKTADTASREVVANIKAFGELFDDAPQDEPAGRAAGISSLLAATGLEALGVAVQEAASRSCNRRSQCFCGAVSTGSWSCEESTTWGCDAHLPRSADRDEAAQP